MLGRVWAAVHYTTSGGSAGSGGVFQTSVSSTRNPTFASGSYFIRDLFLKNIRSGFLDEITTGLDFAHPGFGCFGGCGQRKIE